MFKAVFLDFYGTLVYEDDEVIGDISRKIAASAQSQATAQEIAAYWWKSFSQRMHASYGELFQSQRDIELQSLEDTIYYYKSPENPHKLSELIYPYWQAPQLFEDTPLFLKSVGIPVVILSNIDRADIQSAIRYNQIPIENVITSEDAKAYKPRPDMFLQALEAYNLKPSEVLHVGDSLTSDIGGAQSTGIQAAWLNRKNKQLPQSFTPDYVVNSLTELLPLLGSK